MSKNNGTSKNASVTISVNSAVPTGSVSVSENTGSFTIPSGITKVQFTFATGYVIYASCTPEKTYSWTASVSPGIDYQSPRYNFKCGAMSFVAPLTGPRACNFN